MCPLQSSKKEKKSKKKEKKEEAAEEAPAEAPADEGGEEKAEPKRAQRATSNVFALFNQAQIQEFKEVGHLVLLAWSCVLGSGGMEGYVLKVYCIDLCFILYVILHVFL